jgi:hypothetical protein
MYRENNMQIEQFAISFLIANLDEDVAEYLNGNFSKSLSVDEWERLLQAALSTRNELLEACKDVVADWETGDLASAVRNLSNLIGE